MLNLQGVVEEEDYLVCFKTRHLLSKEPLWSLGSREEVTHENIQIAYLESLEGAEELGALAQVEDEGELLRALIPGI